MSQSDPCSPLRSYRHLERGDVFPVAEFDHTRHPAQVVPEEEEGRAAVAHEVVAEPVEAAPMLYQLQHA